MPDPDTQDLLWFRPDPRAILPLDGFHSSRSLVKKLKKGNFQVSFDQDFPGVMRGCANRPETWITDEFFEAYGKLFLEGHCHSVEIWQEGKLVGGVYGVAIRAAFFAESMFHTVTDASKIALFHLVRHLKSRGYLLLEIQFLTPHLSRLGAVKISDFEYQKRLRTALKREVTFMEQSSLR